jgi:hypothetical protein
VDSVFFLSERTQKKKAHIKTFICAVVFDHVPDGSNFLFFNRFGIFYFSLAYLDTEDLI